MTDSASLAARLREVLAAAGLTVSGRDTSLHGDLKVVLASWLLGRRTVRYRFSCALDEASKTMTLRETMTESAIGLPPPAFFSQVRRQKGTRVEETITVGGKAFEFGRVREAVERLAEGAGWRFRLEPLQRP